MGDMTGPTNTGKQGIADVWQQTTQQQDMNPRSKTKERWQSSTRQLITSFNASTTFHGIRFAFGTDISMKRRMIWFSLCVLSTCLLTVDIAERVQHYMSYPVSVNVQVHYKESMQFPAVTICNQNSFRRTLSVQNGDYDVLNALYGAREDSMTSGSRDCLLDKWSNVTMETLFMNNSHRARDLIVKCKWKGETCTWSDFKPVMTQHGQCFTFLGNTSIEDKRIIDTPGVDNGLDLVLNAEDYDSMVGLHSSSGVKVVLHSATEVPMPEYGNELPTGRHGFMDVKVSKAQNVPPPHGKCVTRPLMYMDMYSYTVGACQMECEMKYVSELCQCRLIHMPQGMNSLPPCNVGQYSRCVVEAKVNYRRLRDVKCSCPIPCKQIWFQPDLSYGTISRFSSSQKKILQDKSLGEQFQHSREIAFPEEMDYFSLYKLHYHLGKTSLQNFYRVLRNLESVDKVLSQASTAIKGFYDVIQVTRKYMQMDHKVYSRFRKYSKLIDVTRLGLDFIELTSYLDSQIRLMESTDITKKRKAHYEMMVAKAKLDINAIRIVLKDKEFLTWLSKQYPDIWFVDDGDLQSNPTPVVYSVPSDLNWMGIYETMTKCEYHLQKYIGMAGAVLKTGVTDLKQLDSFNRTSMTLSNRFEEQRKQMDTFYQIFVVANLEHLSHVLGLRLEPITSVISTFDKKCTTMYITKGIRKASMYLNKSVDFLSQYFMRERSLQTVVKHFDSNEMKYFMAEVRTFASGTFHNNELSMESADCLDMLLDEYYAMLKVYKIIATALEDFQNQDDQSNLLPATDELRNYRFDKTELLEVILVLDDVIKVMEEFKQSLKMNPQFYRDNFLHLNVLFHELRFEQLTQQIDYTIFALMGDIGGAMGLCIGASALSVFEIIDFISVLVGSIRDKKKLHSNPHSNIIHVKPQCESQAVPTVCDSDIVKQNKSQSTW